jgi:MATE family multidrug resistance protein
MAVGVWRADARSLLALAAPVVGVQVGMMAMGVVDAMMLGRVDAAALAAGALGNSVGHGLLMFPMGMLMGLAPLVAQAHGAGDRVRVSGHMRRALVLACVLAVPVSALMWNAEGALALLGQREPVRGEAASYLRGLVPGNLAFYLFGVLRQSLQAMGVVWPALAVIVVANLFNVLANWVLVFGNMGSPALGVLGSACATSLSRWLLVVGLAAVAWPVLAPFLKGGRGGSLRRLQGYRTLVAIGFPIGVQVSLEVWVFSTVAVLMGTLGATELAGHQVALSLAGLSFMVPLGLAGAATTLVGNALGRRDQPAAARAGVLSIALGAGVMALFGVAYFSLPDLLVRAFTDDAGVIAVGTVLLPIAAAFQVVDGTQVVAAGVLRGTADTRVPAVIAFVGYWLVGLPVGLVLAFPGGWGASGLWWGLTAGLASVAVLLLARARSRFSRRIELAEAPAEEPTAA